MEHQSSCRRPLDAAKRAVNQLPSVLMFSAVETRCTGSVTWWYVMITDRRSLWPELSVESVTRDRHSAVYTWCYVSERPGYLPSVHVLCEILPRQDRSSLTGLTTIDLLLIGRLMSWLGRCGGWSGWLWVSEVVVGRPWLITSHTARQRLDYRRITFPVQSRLAGIRMVPECQTILHFAATRDDRGRDNWSSNTARLHWGQQTNTQSLLQDGCITCHLPTVSQRWVHKCTVLSIKTSKLTYTVVLFYRANRTLTSDY